MSFDVYLMTNGELFDRTIVERAFGAAALYTDSGDWGLRYKDGDVSHVNINVGIEPQITGFSANRPPWTTEFWDPVYTVLRNARTFLVWPAMGPAPTWRVARSDWLEFVPADLLESMGPPALVSSGDEITRVIEKSGA